LVFVFSPTYNTAESLNNRQTTNVDVKSLTLPVAVTYQLARYTYLFAGYTFFQQRSGRSALANADVDQNRVRFGIQFGYPINFE
jgi:hypothetical protein